MGPDHPSPALLRVLQPQPRRENVLHDRRAERDMARRPIERPEQVGSARAKKAQYLRYAGALRVRPKAVKSPDVDGHVERSTDPREPSHVTHKEGRLDLVLGDTLLRLRDRDRREVDSGRQQTCLRQKAGE
jgi:hypothetical protein